MSYALAPALQGAIYDRLRADATLAALVGDAIYDAIPAGTLPDLYVSLGPETARDRSDASGGAAEHTLTVSVIHTGAGFLAAKQAASAISDALVGAPLALSRGRLIGIFFRSARAARASDGQSRRIDVTFRARLEDD